MEEKNCYNCHRLKIKKNIMKCAIEAHRKFIPPVTNSSLERAKENYFRYANVCPDFDPEEDLEELKEKE